MLGDGNLRTFAGNSAWSLAATAVVALGALFETVLLAHHLSPDRFGFYLLILAYPDAVQQLLDFHIRDAMTRYLGGFLERGQKAEAVATVKLLWLIDIVVSAIAFAIVAVTSALIARALLRDDSVADLVMVYAAGLFFSSSVTGSGAIMRVLDRFGLAFGISAASAALRITLLAGAIGLGGGFERLVWARAGAEVAAAAMLAAGALWALKPVVWAERRAPMSLLRGRGRELGGFLVSTNLISLVRMASTKLDVILVGALATPAAVALYKIALQFGRLPLLVTDALYTAIYPIIARAVGGGRLLEVRSLTRQASVAVGFVVVPLGLVGLLLATPILEFLVGERFTDATTPLRIIVLGTLPYVTFFWLPAVMFSTGAAGVLLRISVVAVMLQLGALIALVPPYGAGGAAVGVALSYLAAVIIGLAYLVRREIIVLPLERSSKRRERTSIAVAQAIDAAPKFDDAEK